MVYARKALPLYQQLENKVGLVKLRWSVGNILREQRKSPKPPPPIARQDRKRRKLGCAATSLLFHLILADVLLDVGQDARPSGKCVLRFRSSKRSA